MKARAHPEIEVRLAVMREEPPKAAVIISTYNWPQALGLVLHSLLAQSETSCEIVVADDGSKPETAERVAAILSPTPARWVHVRQEDTGFRQSRVRNLGVQVSSAPLLIFIDHDTPLHPDFVADHLRLAGPGHFVQGKRCFLSESATAALIANGLGSGWWPTPWQRELGNRKNAFHCLALGRLLARRKAFESAIRGCNLAVRREDFMRVDGFDELYDGVWGREDSDLAYRLFHCGIRCRNAWFAALQAHLYHRQLKRRDRDALDDELDRMQREKRQRAIRGFSQIDDEGRIVASASGWPDRH